MEKTRIALTIAKKEQAYHVTTKHLDKTLEFNYQYDDRDHLYVKLLSFAREYDVVSIACDDTTYAFATNAFSFVYSETDMPRRERLINNELL